jgi:hypothetical protein
MNTRLLQPRFNARDTRIKMQELFNFSVAYQGMIRFCAWPIQLLITPSGEWYLEPSTINGRVYSECPLLPCHA